MTEHHFDLFPSLSEEERNRSLQELDGQDWGEATFPSYLVRTCHALRRKPPRDFTVEDLRIMIGQNISLEYLVPLAIERLQRDPFAAGDFYPGDLLGSVLKVQSSFWQQRPDLRQVVEAIVALIPDFPDILDKELSVFQQVTS
jgi:hypothetical protein